MYNYICPVCEKNISLASEKINNIVQCPKCHANLKLFIRFNCQKCDKTYQVYVESKGKTTKCKACHSKIVIPESVKTLFPKITKNIFISYSHNDDKKYIKIVLKHLNMIAKEHGFNIWIDEQIRAGDQWEARILSAINQADMSILLISPDFFNSKYIQETELPQILLRHDKNKTILFPIILEDCAFAEYKWIKKTQALPKGCKPLSTFNTSEMNTVCKNIALEAKNLLFSDKQKSIIINSYDEKPQKDQKFDGRIIPTLCNRDIHVEKFYKFFLKNCEKKHKKLPLFFIIHGFENQGHRSLIKRLRFTLIRAYLQKQKITELPFHATAKWPDKGKLSDRKQILARQLFNAFQKMDDISFEKTYDLKRLNQLKAIETYKNNIVIISHNIEASLWDKDLLSWYIENYWNVDNFKYDDIPQFIIFLNIQYPVAIKKGFWGIRSSHSTIKRVKKELTVFTQNFSKNCKLIDELNSITQQHVKDWICKYKSNMEDYEIEEEIESIFENSEHMSMIEIEKKLKNILLKS